MDHWSTRRTWKMVTSWHSQLNRWCLPLIPGKLWNKTSIMLLLVAFLKPAWFIFWFLKIIQHGHWWIKLESSGGSRTHFGRGILNFKFSSFLEARNTNNQVKIKQHFPKQDDVLGVFSSGKYLKPLESKEVHDDRKKWSLPGSAVGEAAYLSHKSVDVSCLVATFKDNNYSFSFGWCFIDVNRCHIHFSA